MIEQQQALELVRDEIRKCETLIAVTEQFMRDAPLAPPIDIEEVRIALWRLKRGEQLLLQRMKRWE
jgi:hypothetical protein